MRPNRSLIILLAAVTAAVAHPVAQQGQAPAFEAASIRPTDPSAPPPIVNAQPQSVINAGMNGRLTAANATLRALIARAYSLHDSQLIGAPDWIASTRYDIDARAAGQPAEGPQALMRMLRTLLAERFKLRVHTETRALPAYVLTVARSDRRLGTQIRPTEADCTGKTPILADAMRANARDGWPPCNLVYVVSFVVPDPSGTISKTRIRRSGITMPDFAVILQASVDRPVVDRTGLEGRFDLEYTSAPNAPGTSALDNAPNLLVALEEQLGLKLDSQRAEVPVLVIDSVERPTDN